MNSNFIMANCLYPLKDKMKILDMFYFDNPRTINEIKEIATILKDANYMYSPLPEMPLFDNEGKEFLSLKSLLEATYKNYAKGKYIDLNKKKYKNIYYQLASDWVVLRYENSNNECLRDNALAFVNLLSFISFDRDYWYLLLSEFFEEYSMKNLINKHSKNIIIEFMVKALPKGRSKEPLSPRYTKFDLIYNELKKNQSLLKDKMNSDLIIYIAESLQNYSNLKDDKLKIVALVSIFELLVTHNPDNSRFNVEDSIRKQFVNKLIILLHINTEISNVAFYEKELSLIYDLRSSIAHGNFTNLDKICKKIYILYEENNDKIYSPDIDNVLGKIQSTLLRYLRVVLVAYLKDPQLFEILKK